MIADLRVAIVDDDDSARAAVAGLVRALGFIAMEFQSPADFLAAGGVQRTACLVTDMRMPGMTGLELHRSLVATGTPVPTILITAYPDEVVRRQASSAGIACCLAKPIRPDALLACIRAAVAGGATPQEKGPEP